MAGLWRNIPGRKVGKYIVIRTEDFKTVDRPFFVLAASDPIAADTLRYYSARAEAYGMDMAYVRDTLAEAQIFDDWRKTHKYVGQPDGGPVD